MPYTDALGVLEERYLGEGDDLPQRVKTFLNVLGEGEMNIEGKNIARRALASS